MLQLYFSHKVTNEGEAASVISHIVAYFIQQCETLVLIYNMILCYMLHNAVNLAVCTLHTFKN